MKESAERKRIADAKKIDSDTKSMKTCYSCKEEIKVDAHVCKHCRLRRNRNSNKQIFMITDGKPSCLKLKDGTYYKNSNGLDSHIVDKCYNMAQQARRLNIPITTFMIAQDPYLKSFVQEFTKANKGKAFYTGLKGLGEMIFEDYETNRKKRLK